MGRKLINRRVDAGFLADLEQVIKDLPKLTNDDLSRMFKCSVDKIKSAKSQIGIIKGEDVTADLNPAERAVIENICELLAYNPELTNAELSHRTEYDAETVSMARLYISDSDVLQMREKLVAAGHGAFVFVPDFKPTIYPVMCTDGVVRMCMNEYVGIVEYGGRCYKNYHYVIPCNSEKGGFLDDIANPMDKETC